MPKLNGPSVPQAAKMKITLWAGANKTRFDGASIRDGREMIQKEFGVKLSDVSIKTIFSALDLQPSRDRVKAGQSVLLKNKVALLARILRAFMKEAGAVKIPDALEELCADNHKSNGNGQAH